MRNGLSYSEAGKIGAVITSKLQKQRKQQRINEYNKQPTVCNYCGKALPYKKRHDKFCNHSCSASSNNKGINRHGTNVFKLKNCLHCNKELSKTAQKYCSVKCQKKHEWQQTKNIIEKNQKTSCSKQGHSYLLETRGNKCEICGLTEWRGEPILLVLDHINGHHENWNLSNLRMICSNCDAQTPFYKGKNRGNGRVGRMKRYHEGKSY